MTEKNKHAKPYWSMRMLVLILLLVFTMAYLIVGTFARYVSSSGGEDSARVARFAISSTFTGTETEQLINCQQLQGQTGDEIIANSRCSYPIKVNNFEIIDGVKYIAETSQKVDIQVISDQEIDQVYGLVMSLTYPSDNEILYSGTPIVNEDGDFVYTFADVYTFPVNPDGTGPVEQEFACTLHFYITTDSVQPVTSMQFRVSAVGIQLD